MKRDKEGNSGWLGHLSRMVFAGVGLETLIEATRTIDAKLKTTKMDESGASDKDEKDDQATKKPKKAIQAFVDPSWIEAMQEELLQFKLQKVWTLVDLSNGKRPIGTKWVFRNKKDERGIVVRNKARLVAQGYTQEEGIDYDEVLLLEGNGWPPPGFKDSLFPKKVYKVEKALYGLYQAPRAWYETLSTYLIKNGFRRGTTDKTLFIKKDKGDILSIWIIDVLNSSRPDIMFVKFCACARDSPFDLEAFLDSDYAGASLDRKSTTGGAMDPNQCLIMDLLIKAFDVSKAKHIGDNLPGIELRGGHATSNKVPLPNTEIFEQLALMGYASDSDKLTFQKGPIQQGEGSTVLVESHHTPITTPSTSQPPLSSPSRVTRLEQDLKQTKKVYSNAYTKLIMRVKKLEHKVKSRQPRRRARVVISDTEEDLEDPSKQGEKCCRLIKPLYFIGTGDEKIKKQLGARKTWHEEAINCITIMEERQRIARDEEIALQLQKEFNRARQEQEVVADQAHDIDWSDHVVLRYHALQNRSFSIAKVRKNIVWDQNYAFVPKDSKIEKEVMKRPGFYFPQKSIKKNDDSQQQAGSSKKRSREDSDKDNPTAPETRG
ncbi:putative ribonuclease H-like domain-containing protein [Tanacetum coccineum]